MSELQVVEQKDVDFQGVELIGIKTEDGNIYVGMQWVGQGIGFTRDKVRREIKKAKQDEVVNRGLERFGGKRCYIRFWN